MKGTILASQRERSIPAIKIELGKRSAAGWMCGVSRIINRYLYNLEPVGIGMSVSRYSNTISLYCAKSDKQLYECILPELKLANFGSGSFCHSRWQNYDYPAQSRYYEKFIGKPNKDYLPIDFNKDNALAGIKDGSHALIYFAHVIEHLEEAKGAQLLEQFYRILVNGGVARLVMPDWDAYMSMVKFSLDSEEYSANLSDLARPALALAFSDIRLLSLEKLSDLMAECKLDLEDLDSIVDNYMVGSKLFNPMQPSRHISLWQERKLKKYAREAGFKKVIRVHQSHSTVPAFTNSCVFDNTEPFMSAYYELIK